VNRVFVPASLAFALSSCTIFGDATGIGGGPRTDIDGTTARDGGAPEASAGEAPVRDASVVTPTGDASPAELGLVQSRIGQARGETAFPIAVAPTKAGNLMVVVVAQETNDTTLVSSITDDAGNVYLSTNHRSVDPACDNTLEVWFTSIVRPGATRLTIRMPLAVKFEAWAMEFSGLRTFDKGATLDAQRETILITAPAVTPSSDRALTLSAASSCGDITNLVDADFQALPILNGHNVAFSFTASARAASWIVRPAETWSATTVVFQ
jgi:hypothetical protein